MSFQIEAYSFGSITINGKTFNKDLIICPDGIREKWWRKEGHGLYPEDLEAVIDLAPKTLIIGTGSPGRLTVPQSTKAWLDTKGIELIELPTKQACDRYNKYPDKSNLLAGFHLTC